MRIIASAFLVGICASCASHSGEATQSFRLVANGARFDVAFVGRFLSDPRFAGGASPRIIDLLPGNMGGWVPHPGKPIVARVSRTKDTLSIEAVDATGAVDGRWDLGVSEVIDGGQRILRHEERKTLNDEWGSKYLTERDDFFLAVDGGLIEHIHSKGVATTLVIIPYPAKKDILMVFPRLPNQSTDPTLASGTPLAGPESRHP
jgi:hypothetical protein